MTQSMKDRLSAFHRLDEDRTRGKMKFSIDADHPVIVADNGVHYAIGARHQFVFNAIPAMLKLADEQASLIDEMRESLDYLLQQTVDQDLKHGITLTEGEEDARQRALAVIARAAA
jgi:hypothetical protein